MPARIVFGKTNVPKYSADMQTFNELFGLTATPHDPSRSPGRVFGRSRGRARVRVHAARARSDIGGSIRTPANWTGVYGHKPSYGLVPQRGHVPWAPGALASQDLSVCGPLARSAEDLALELGIIAGPDGARTTWLAARARRTRTTRLAKFRIAAWLDDRAFPSRARCRACSRR